MYPQSLPYLACPTCHASLALHAPAYDSHGEIVGGALRCAGCAGRYPIHDGVADFLGTPQPATPAQVVNEWPLTAWAYERAWRPLALTLLSGEPFAYRRELPLLAGLMQPQRGGLFLDIACSNGLYARALTRAMGAAPGHVVGIDHSLPFLHEARRFARQAGLRISYARAEAQALPIAPGRAAGAAIGGSINEIGDLRGCLREVRRTLAADGRYVAMWLASAATPLGRAVQQALSTGGVVFPREAEMRDLLAQQQLRLVGSWRYGLVVFNLALPAAQ